MVATQNPFELGGFPLQLRKLEPVEGTYTTTRAGADGLQRLTLQLNADRTSALTLQQSDEAVTWRGTWETLASGDAKVTLHTDGGIQRITFTRESGMLRAAQWDKEAWGSASLVFVKG